MLRAWVQNPRTADNTGRRRPGPRLWATSPAPSRAETRPRKSRVRADYRCRSSGRAPSCPGAAAQTSGVRKGGDPRFASLMPPGPTDDVVEERDASNRRDEEQKVSHRSRSPEILGAPGDE